jgi:hypothetical protein
LAAVAARIATERGLLEIDSLTEERRKEERSKDAAEAVTQFHTMTGQLLARIRGEAPNAEVLESVGSRDPQRIAVRLGRGDLSCSLPHLLLEVGRVGMGWDVLVGGVIEVEGSTIISAQGSLHYRRSANLWFGRIGSGKGYRWWEVGYMRGPRAARRNGEIIAFPFAIEDPHLLDGLQYGVYELAYNPRPIDGEHFEEFYLRWSNWLAEVAAEGQLRPPTLPEEAVDPRFIAT